MRIALIADWLPTFGGAEHVVAEFHRLWPEAPIFTTVARPEALGPLSDANIRTDVLLQRIYRLTGKHAILLPLMPRAMERIDLTGFDVILSSSHAVGKGIVPPSNAKHICYCHTPMRYAWEMENQYLSDFRIPKALLGAAKRLLSRMRRWDMTTAKRVDQFIANSSTTQERIKRIYGRDSVVVPPPVDERFFARPLAEKPKDRPRSFLAIGRLVPYKRFDLLITVANALNLPLTIVGSGSDLPRLRALAGPTVTFLGHQPDHELPRLYSEASAVLFPQVEDAGVVPLESQASGTPVIALGQGGILDTVKDGVTGILFTEQTETSLKEALKRFDLANFDSAVIREHAKQFSAERFRSQILTTVKSL